MEAINDGMKNRGINMKTVGVTEIRHFLYKNKKNTQLLCSEIAVPYNTLGKFFDFWFQLSTDFKYFRSIRATGNALL